MQWDPNTRLSTARVLAHPYFEASAMPESAPPDANRLPQLPSAANNSIPDIRKPAEGYRAPQQQSGRGFFPPTSDAGGWGAGRGSLDRRGEGDSSHSGSKVPTALPVFSPNG